MIIELEATRRANRDGDPYLAALVDSKVIQRFLPTLESCLGERKARRYALNLRRRNGGTFHVTLLSPYETGMLHTTVLANTIVRAQAHLHGVGAVRKQEDETCYVVVTCPVFQSFRRRLGLPPRDFHITLGFRKRDIHNVNKGLSTLIPGQQFDNAEERPRQKPNST